MYLKTFFFIALLCSTWVWSQDQVRVLGNLPEAVFETSGLIFDQGKLITHNDSGHLAQLFEIDTLTLGIARTVNITNAENVDWEDLTHDNDYIYIGDFGNNLGTRRDLVIYRISKQDYHNGVQVVADKIEFNYADQTDFTNNGNSDWDAEAFIVLNDRLILFTKQWKTNGTAAYSIPKTPGNHIAEKLETFNASGLVTGAAYNPNTQVMYIIGYSNFLSPFIIRIENPTSNALFGGPVERMDFGSSLAQIEGIAYVNDNSYFVSSELFTNTSPNITLESQLFAYKTTDSKEEPVTPEEPEPQVTSNLVIYQTKGESILGYELVTDRTVYGWAIHDTTGKKLRFQKDTPVDIKNGTIDLSAISAGVYYLTFYLDNGRVSKAFSRN